MLSQFKLNSKFSKVFYKVPRQVVISWLFLLSININSFLISILDLLLPIIILTFTVLYPLDVIIKSSVTTVTEVSKKIIKVV